MTVKTISAAEAQSWLAAGEAVLIDVREPPEYAASHIPYALSLPLGSLPESLGHAPIAPKMKLIVQCLKGGRGAHACDILSGYGMAHDVYNLDGGIMAWTQAGLPVVGAAPGGISIFRQVQMIVGLLVLIATIVGLCGFPAGFYAAAVLGFMLAFAGLSGWCGMALLLRHMPWNRS